MVAAFQLSLRVDRLVIGMEISSCARIFSTWLTEFIGILAQQIGASMTCFSMVLPIQSSFTALIVVIRDLWNHSHSPLCVALPMLPTSPNQSAPENRRLALRATRMDDLNINFAFHARGPAAAELGRWG